MGFLSLGRLAALAAIFLPLVFTAPTTPAASLKIRNLEARDVIPHSYIIVYKNGISALEAAAHESDISSAMRKRSSTMQGIGSKWRMEGFQGYQIEADASIIDQIATAPEVDYIELDARVYASGFTAQNGSTYGLARISHHKPGGSTYIYDTSAGSGTRIYVVDTGINIAHSQFGGRAIWGTNFVSGSPDTDENGHGTHCSGTAAGSTYGVAKSATLVAVKVLDASGSGSNSGVISGIQYVATNAKSLGASAKSVLSMSLGGPVSSALNAAVAATVGSGVTVVVAAGNADEDAGTGSPSSEPSAITVAAVDSADARASFSNFGPLVDVFAPGVDVLSAWIGSANATNVLSGTSMATPHVAGLAAYLIALEGLGSPAAVVSRITALATAGTVTDPGPGSPNLIAYNGNGA